MAWVQAAKPAARRRARSVRPARKASDLRHPGLRGDAAAFVREAEDFSDSVALHAES